MPQPDAGAGARRLVNCVQVRLVDSAGHGFQTARPARPRLSENSHACCQPTPRPTAAAASGRPPRLVARRSPRPVRPALPGAAAPRRQRAPRALRPGRSPGQHPAVDQDRRLPRGLRLLPAGRALPHRRRRDQADVDRGGGGKGQAGQGRRRLALLHGRGLAFAEGPRHPQGRGDDPRGEGAGPGDLRHAGHALGRPGQGAARPPAWTTTTTTSTPRRSSTARSSTPANSRTASTRSRTCATSA